MTRTTNNKVQYRIGSQSAFDTAATSTEIWAGALSDTLQPVPEFIESDEETGKLVVDDHLLVGMSTRGDVEVEWRYSAHDTVLPWVLNSAGWSSELADPGGAVTVTPGNSGGINQLTLSAGNWNDAGVMGATFSRGMWIYVSGFSNSVNNGYFRVESSTASGTINVGGLTTMTSESAVAFSALTVVGMAQIVTGTTQTLASIERDYSDQSGSQRYAQLLNQLASGFSVGYDSAKGLLTGNFSFIGSHDTTSASALDASPTAATTNGQIRTADVNGFVEDLNPVAPQPIVAWTLRTQNNNYQFDEIGTMRPLAFGLGRMNITGTITTYWENDNIYARAISESGSNTTALALIIEHSAGSYVFDVPQARLMNPRRGRGRRDQGLLVTFDYAADWHIASSAGLRICRKAA